MKELLQMLVIWMFAKMPARIVLPATDADGPFDSDKAELVAEGWLPTDGKVRLYYDRVTRRYAAVSRVRGDYADLEYAKRFVGRFNPSKYYELFK